MMMKTGRNIHGPWAVFSIASALFFLSQFYRSANAVIAAQLLRDLNLDTSGLGTLSAGFFYAFAVTQIPISLLIDRIGAKRIMLALSAVGIIGALIFSTASDMRFGMLGRILLGVGMACNLIGALKLLTVFFEARLFATLSGIVFAIGYAGNIASTTPFAFSVQHLGWRLSIQMIALLNLIFLALFQVIVQEPRCCPAVTPLSGQGFSKKTLFANLQHLFKKKDYWIISLSTTISYGIFAAIQTLWAGPFLREVLVCSEMVTANLIFLINLGLIMGGPSWGLLSDRLWGTRKWIIVLGLGLILIILISFLFLGPHTNLWLLALLFFGFGLFRSSGMLMYPHIKELMPLSMAGTAMTGINFFTMIGPALFLQGIGELMQTLYPAASRSPEAFRAAFILCAACLSVVVVFYCFTKDTRSDTKNITV